MLSAQLAVEGGCGQAAGAPSRLLHKEPTEAFLSENRIGGGEGPKHPQKKAAFLSLKQTPPSSLRQTCESWHLKPIFTAASACCPRLSRCPVQERVRAQGRATVSGRRRREAALTPKPPEYKGTWRLTIPNWKARRGTLSLRSSRVTSWGLQLPPAVVLLGLMLNTLVTV